MEEKIHALQAKYLIAFAFVFAMFSDILILQKLGFIWLDPNYPKMKLINVFYSIFMLWGVYHLYKLTGKKTLVLLFGILLVCSTLGMVLNINNLAFMFAERYGGFIKNLLSYAIPIYLIACATIIALGFTLKKLTGKNIIFILLITIALLPIAKIIHGYIDPSIYDMGIVIFLNDSLLNKALYYLPRFIYNALSLLIHGALFVAFLRVKCFFINDSTISLESKDRVLPAILIIYPLFIAIAIYCIRIYVVQAPNTHNFLELSQRGLALFVYLLCSNIPIIFAFHTYLLQKPISPLIYGFLISLIVFGFLGLVLVYNILYYPFLALFALSYYEFKAPKTKHKVSTLILFGVLGFILGILWLILCIDFYNIFLGEYNLFGHLYGMPSYKG